MSKTKVVQRTYYVDFELDKNIVKLAAEMTTAEKKITKSDLVNRALKDLIEKNKDLL